MQLQVLKLRKSFPVGLENRWIDKPMADRGEVAAANGRGPHGGTGWGDVHKSLKGLNTEGTH